MLDKEKYLFGLKLLLLAANFSFTFTLLCHNFSVDIQQWNIALLIDLFPVSMYELVIAVWFFCPIRSVIVFSICAEFTARRHTEGTARQRTHKLGSERG